MLGTTLGNRAQEPTQAWGSDCAWDRGCAARVYHAVLLPERQECDAQRFWRAFPHRLAGRRETPYHVDGVIEPPLGRKTHPSDAALTAWQSLNPADCVGQAVDFAASVVNRK